MKRKIFSVLFALALGLILIVLPASPMLAAGTPNPTFVTIDVSVTGMSVPADEITIRWERIGAGSAQSGTDVIYITTNAVDTTDLALVRVPTDFTLDGSTTASYWGYRISTENCTIRMPYETYWLLDTNSDSDVDTVLSNNYHPVGTAGVWLEWNMASASAKWCTVDLSTGAATPVVITDYYGSTVLGIALVAGSSTGAKVDAYLDNLVVNGETLLDDDTGTIEVLSGTIDGTPWTCSIQDGIDAALPGDTVNVAAGEYDEALTIDKSLTLESTDGWYDTVIWPPAGSVITFGADFAGDVIIDGFAIVDGNYGIHINGLGSAGSIDILNCLIDWNNTGIYAEGDLAGHITINGCIITRTSGDGIYLENIDIEGVVQVSNSFIGGWWDDEHNNIFDGNSGDGIEIDEISGDEFGGGEVYINYNVIAENGGNGIYVTGESVYGTLGITDSYIGAYDYDVEDGGVGYFTGNAGCGILIETVEETGTVNIEDNRLAENGDEGIGFYNDTTPLGIEIYGDVTINNNTIGAWTQWDEDESQRYDGNGGDGIGVDEVYEDGSLDITNNRLAENYYDGIYIYKTEGAVNISGNFAGSWTEEPPGEPDIIYDGNGWAGIYVEYVPDGSLLIRGNDVSGNLLEDNSGDESSGAITVIDNSFGGGTVTIGGTGLGEANFVDSNGVPEADSGYDVGIYLSAVDYATIEGNTVTNHIDPAGFYELGGICLESSSYNYIIVNTITNNGGGIGLESSSYNEISGNTITNNYGGIFLDDSSDNNSVTDNVIQDNDEGIAIGGANNDILWNVISGNLGEDCAGIYLWGEGNVIHYNNITNNTDIDGYGGVYNGNDATDVDATLNWWGDASGPYQETTNPGGLGDEVSEDVIYSPWLGYTAETSPMTFIVDNVGPEPTDGYIKTAVNAAAGGDTVLVHPGTYLEKNITIDKSLTVQSVSGDRHDTIVDPAGFNVFQFISFSGDVTISGLTINGGDYGIYIEGMDAGSSITVSNCHIYEAGLAGIFAGDGLYGDIFIDDCVIGENGFEESFGIGGIHLDNTVAGRVEITDSVIGSYWDSIGNYFPNTGDGIQIDSIFTTGNVLIDNCKIVNNTGYGISDAIFGCHGQLTITNNIIGAYDYDPAEPLACFTGNGNFGIHIDYVGATGIVTIENNKLAENSGGIHIEQNNGKSTISNNYAGTWTQTIGGTEVTHNGNNGMGILIDNTLDGNLLIEDNNVSQNTSHGIDVHNNADGDGEVTISGNTIDENGSGGYGLYLGEVDYATISGNTITNQSDDLWAGVFLGSSDYNTISDNTINENYFGIRIDSESNNNRVVNNIIEDNTIDGILIDGDANEILGNTISNNQGALLCGIRLTDTAEDNVIHFNNITGNTLGFSVGVYNEAAWEVDAENNWWGDKSGPYYDPDNLDGLGDAVSGNVDYEPWLGAQVTGFVMRTGAGGDVDATDETDTVVYVWGGTADVYIAQYGSNPGSAFSGDTGKYIDIMIQNLIGVGEIEIKLYYTDAEIAGKVESSLRLRWWNGTSWIVCSDSGVDTTDILIPPPGGAPYSGYMWAKIRNDTTPTLAELTGTPFGGGGSTTGGGGVGGVGTVGTVLPHDTTPQISNVLHEVTDTTANISWTTDEESTSQVEYWASPGTLSPLNTAYVLTHHVRLAGLTPNTTYHYKVMSKDSVGNLAVSEEYTFTTLKAPAAAFTASNLSISPAEVDIDGMVTISLSVANTSGTGVSYTVVLKINGVKEAEQSITLAAGKSQNVSFSVTRTEAGSYSVDVNGLTGIFTVAAAAAPIAWWIWVIAGVVVAGLIIFFVVRRRA